MSEYFSVERQVMIAGFVIAVLGYFVKDAFLWWLGIATIFFIKVVDRNGRVAERIREKLGMMKVQKMYEEMLK